MSCGRRDPARADPAHERSEPAKALAVVQAMPKMDEIIIIADLKKAYEAA